MATKDPVLEAKRYVENARTILREKAIKEDDLYTDRKYVKLAGHAAYTGVLVALDSFFGVKTKKRKDVNWYKEQLATIDKKLLGNFVKVFAFHNTVAQAKCLFVSGNGIFRECILINTDKDVGCTNVGLGAVVRLG